MKPHDTRQHILDTGNRIIAGKGFSCVGLNEILQAAEVPKGSFYHYFKSKEQFGQARHWVASASAARRRGWRSRPSAPTATTSPSSRWASRHWPPVPRRSRSKASTPRLPTPAVEPVYAGSGALAWLVGEVRDHLWPWSREGWHSQKTLQIAGLALAIAATIAWVQAALGHLSSGAIIGWWFRWSV